jgi:hypothetical protein
MQLTAVNGRKGECVPVPLHPSLISHGLVQDRTRSSALRVQYHSTNVT